MTQFKDVEKSGTRAVSQDLPEDDATGMNTTELIDTNNKRPDCFTSTVQEILFVLSATMAIAMSGFLSGAVAVTSASIGRRCVE
jgi:hypothetical protein